MYNEEKVGAMGAPAGMRGDARRDGQPGTAGCHGWQPQCGRDEGFDMAAGAATTASTTGNARFVAAVADGRADHAGSEAGEQQGGRLRLRLRAPEGTDIAASGRRALAALVHMREDRRRVPAPLRSRIEMLRLQLAAAEATLHGGIGRDKALAGRVRALRTELADLQARAARYGGA